MYESFKECLHALLTDDRLDDAYGGSIACHQEGFDYRLHGQPDGGGEVYFQLLPSSTPKVKWRALPVTKEAEQAYRAFISDPRNGTLLAEA